jgi:hypothetical protein
LDVTQLSALIGVVLGFGLSVARERRDIYSEFLAQTYASITVVSLIRQNFSVVAANDYITNAARVYARLAIIAPEQVRTAALEALEAQTVYLDQTTSDELGRQRVGQAISHLEAAINQDLGLKLNSRVTLT